MQKQTISIMGCGWLGFPLAKKLLEKGYIVNGSTTHTEKLPLLSKAGIYPFLLHANPLITGENQGTFFDADLLILNIPPGRRRSDVKTFHPQQIKSIVNAAQNGRVSKLIFLSSTGVYGDQNREVRENDLVKPNTDSGLALQEVENWLLKQKLETTILRLGGLVGGDRKAGRFLAGKKGVKNGGAPVNLLHRTDGIGIIEKIIEQEVWGEIFNCCADKHPTRKAFYIAQANKQGFEPPEFLDEDVFKFKIVSNKKVKVILNYSFYYPDPMDF